MKILSFVSAAACIPLVFSHPLTFPYNSVASITDSTQTDSDNSGTTSQSIEEQINKPWQVFSLLKRPFENQPRISFIFRDPNTAYETICRSGLPMSGYAPCDDANVMFLYGGVSYQHGDTWLAISRQDVHVCDETTVSQREYDSRTESNSSSTQCDIRSASGTADMTHSFWQQPGWNSWVHPEELELEWGWT